jgi:hypothetical protein
MRRKLAGKIFDILPKPKDDFLFAVGFMRIAWEASIETAVTIYDWLSTPSAHRYRLGWLLVLLLSFYWLIESRHLKVEGISWVFEPRYIQYLLGWIGFGMSFPRVLRDDHLSKGPSDTNIGEKAE